MQGQELAALRAELAAVPACRVQRSSAVVKPAQHASQAHDQHPPPQKGSSSQQCSIGDSAPPALGAPSQHTTPCRPQGMPVNMATAPPAKAQESASGGANAGISCLPVSLQPSCASKHTVLGKRDISKSLRSRQGELLPPAADTADELEVGLCASICDVICRSVITANSNVTLQVRDAAHASSWGTHD